MIGLRLSNNEGRELVIKRGRSNNQERGSKANVKVDEQWLSASKTRTISGTSAQHFNDHVLSNLA